MKRALIVSAVALALLACSSSDDEPACQIVGTYTMTAVTETQTAGCAAVTDDGTPTTLTISADGAGYLVEIGGTEGSCPAEVIGACKIQSKCGLALRDPVDPNNATGTLQYSWTFKPDGFSGLNSGVIPAAKSLPDGCTFTSTATGTRR